MATQQQSPQTNLAKTTPAAMETERTREAIAPTVDVYENENEVLVLADLPGVTQDKLTIHFDKGRLTIEGRRSPPQWSPRFAETTLADFRRTFLVPQGIDANQISAELAQGVLQVHLPKLASAKPRRIEVKAS